MSIPRQTIGRPRTATTHGGIHLLLRCEWEKCRKRLPKIVGGAEFLRRPKADQERFFIRLAVIAATPAGVAVNHARWFLDCYATHPDVMLFVLPALRRRIGGIDARGGTYWKAALGYVDTKATQAARDAQRDVRKAFRASGVAVPILKRDPTPAEKKSLLQVRKEAARRIVQANLKRLGTSVPEEIAALEKLWATPQFKT